MTDLAHGADRLGDAPELLTRFVEDSLELREGALFDAAGRQMFATDDGDWTAGVTRIWEAAEAGERDVAYVHVGTEAGDVLAVRGPAGSAVALSERFPLASLVLSDLRAVLRELDRAGTAEADEQSTGGGS